jgi:hypothetical protein
MMRQRKYLLGFFTGLCLYLLTVWSGCWRDSPQTAKWPFFAICMDTHDLKKRTLEQQAALLKDLGYAGCGHLQLPEAEHRAKTLSDAGLRLFQVYISVDLGKPEPIDMPALVQILPALQTHKSHLALMITGGSPSDSSLDKKAVALIRDLMM